MKAALSESPKTTAPIAIKKRVISKSSTTTSLEDKPSPTTDVWNLLWPHRNGVIGNPGECTVLLQIDPEDATKLEMEGASGAIGRLEVDEKGGTLNGREFCFGQNDMNGGTYIAIN